MMAREILVVEDDALMRSFYAGVLAEAGYRVEIAGDGAEGLAKLREAPRDLVLTDLRLPKLDGVALLREGRQARPDARWIVITAHGSIANAVEAMKAGASDYLTKPLSGPEELRLAVARVLREADAESRLALHAEEERRERPPEELVFAGAAMAPVRALVERVAPAPATVLISGASGTGKELIARTIHAWSQRREAPFVAVHCAALPESLLESELFGHERGAFTGASAGRKGRFELADGGTLFLDEIGEVPAAMQVKLLRVLQEQEFERLGGTRPVRVDVRLVAATNRDLRALVAEGRFREDLFYRLNVFPVQLPPLAERRDALRQLVPWFVRRFAARSAKPEPLVTTEALEALEEYAWPGNVRELQNVLERAVILSTGRIDVEELALERAERRSGEPGLLRSLEREAIVRVLAEVDGNRRAAAERLGISLRTLQYRIKEYGL
jgi:DNA-binding NtrC family response regulator